MRKTLLVLIIALLCACVFAAANPFAGTWDTVDNTYRRISIKFNEDLSFRAVVLYPRFRGYEYEEAAGTYSWDEKTGILTFRPKYRILYRYDSMEAIVLDPVKTEYAFNADRPGQLTMFRSVFKKDNKLSFEAVITKQKEIQENLYLDTQL
ncbi:MAG: hypothetical protein II544_02585 [Spirochaetales bacterium]|nr:hypothetical protein [Spirochaetales bacterium]